MKETVTEMLTGCLGLIKSDHICMLVTKIGFLVRDKNVGLCLYIVRD